MSGFTPEEERVLKDVAVAFTNGKRIADLPKLDLVTPSEMLIEVSDKNNESASVSIGQLFPYIENQAAYGIEIDHNSKSPDLKRVGNLDLHRSLPIQSKMRGCLLSDDGVVNKYLNPNDWSDEVLDGSQGQVMVEIPEFYYRCYYPDDDHYRVMISEFNLEGYTLHPKIYVGAYLSWYDPKVGVLAHSTADGTRVPSYAVVIDAFAEWTKRCASRNVGAAHNWASMRYDTHRWLSWLFCIEYGTLNAQKEFIAELDDRGFKQGGLGSGTSQCYKIPLGVTNKIGNNTGVDVTTKSFRYRGIENLYSELNTSLTGIKCADSDNGLEIYELNPSKIGEDIPEEYLFAYTAVINKREWVCEVAGGNNGDIIPVFSEKVGSSSSYFCGKSDTKAYPSYGDENRFVSGYNGRAGEQGLFSLSREVSRKTGRIVYIV